MKFSFILSFHRLSIEQIHKMEFTIKLMEAKVEQAVKLKDEKSETVETNEIDVEENNNLSIVPKTVGTDSSQPQEAALISKKQKKMNKRMQQRFAAVQKKHPAGSSNEINRPRIPPLKIKLSEIFKRKHKKRSGVKSKKIVPGKVLSTEGKSDDETADEVESLESKSQLKECSVKLERCDEGAIRIKLEPSEEIPDAPLEVDKTNFLAISNVYSDFPMDFESGEVKLEVEATNMSQAVVPTEPDKMVMRRVSHMCYSINQGILVYRCRLCPYEDSLKFQFEKHLKQLHRNHRWFGSCMTCSTDPTSETGTLFDELKHMFYAHILTETVLITNLPAKPAPMVSIPYDSLIRLNPPKIDELGCNLLSAGKTLKKLRPWLHAAKVSHQKIAADCEAMLKIVCLNALFKCMSVGCSFYTNDDDLFRTHLALHMKHQGADIKNFSQCSYCPFSAQSCAQLVEHVVNEHGSDRYQCSYCFFRSYDLQIDTHQKLYHAVKKFNIIKCHQTVMKSSSKELEAVWENCQTNLPGMSCMGKSPSAPPLTSTKFILLHSLQEEILQLRAVHLPPAHPRQLSGFKVPQVRRNHTVQHHRRPSEKLPRIRHHSVLLLPIWNGPARLLLDSHR